MLDSKEKKETSSEVFSGASSGVFADALDAVLNNVKSPTREGDAAVDVDKINRLILDLPEDKVVPKNVDKWAKKPSMSKVGDELELVEFGDENDLLKLEKEGVTVLEVESTEYNSPELADNIEAVIPMADFDLSYEKKIDAVDIESKGKSKDLDPRDDGIDFQIGQKTEDVEKTKIAIDEINGKITALSTDNDHLKQQMFSLAAPIGQYIDASEKMDELKKEQGRIRKNLLDNEENKPASPTFALGTALLSLLLAGGLGFIGYGVQSDISELSGLVSTLEEEIDSLKVASPSANISKIDDKINLLIENDNHLNKQLNDVTRVLQSNSIKTVIYGLVEQNTQTNNTIEQLMAKVESLEKGRGNAVSSNSIAPASKRLKVNEPTAKGQKKNNSLTVEKVKVVAEKKIVVEKKAVVSSVPAKKKVPTLVTQKKAQVLATKKNSNIVKGSWVINLASFNRRADADAKLSEFNKKGISAEVIKAKVNGSDWYRIRSKGFKTKSQAASFSTQAKKKLKLKSTWITKI